MKGEEEAMSRRVIILIAVVIAALSWGGLAGLIFFTRAPLPARVAFFVLLSVALTATFVPLAFYLNSRFSRSETATDPRRPLRQSAWAALFLVVCAWLQMIRALHWIVAALLAGVFILLETFFLTRNTSR
jgi:prepilin signal peptidase PulO-like enzyme (type II secretory pathway)